MISVTGPRNIDLKVPVQCAACGRTIDVKMRNSGPGTLVPCPCGTSIKLVGDDLRKVQAGMDNLVSAINKIGGR